MINLERFRWDEVATWIDSEDIELQGAAFQVLASKRRAVDGQIDQVRVETFFVQYLIRCMKVDVASGKVFEMLPYLAARSLSNLYCRLCEDDPIGAQATLARIREELEHLYLEGDAKQKERVVNGALEHIFEDAVCRKDFQNWAEHPDLSPAFKAAAEWADDHPKGSPGGPDA
jgi:hypothetical protein